MSNDVHLKYVNYVIYLRNYVTVLKIVRHNFVIVIIYSMNLELIQVNIISGKKYKSNIITVMVDLLIIKIN